MMKYSTPLTGVILLLSTFGACAVPAVASNVNVDEDEGVCLADDSSCVQAHTGVECNVYMAPSTIGVANMGIYTAVALQPGDVVNYPEIAIPLLFRDWGYHGDNPDGTLWDRYIWDHGVANTEPKKSDLKREDSGAVFVPGVGCTINSRLELNNILSTHGSVYDTAGLHRSKDPGAGAFSPYHSSQTTAHRPLEPGAELFAAYGDTWIPKIPGAVITLDDNMDDADDFLDEYKEFVASSKLDGAVKEGLWNLTKEFPYRSIVLGALPQQPWSVVEEELESGREASATRRFIDRIGRRSVDWLKQHGKCQDHLKPGRSTLEQAGRGAFAARDLPRGTVVGYAPLVHIGNAREILTVQYSFGDAGNYTLEDLIINYSFGHPNSTVLLTPYGAMVNYINHHRERANVRVEWPSKELVAHKPDWLEKDAEFLSNVHEKIGLSFDYVALRDLEEGEEIFMDYGDDWVRAWEEHARGWKPPGGGAEKYVHSSEWPAGEPLRTLEELHSDPYPPNLVTLCRESYRSEPDGTRAFVPVLRESPRRRYCDVLDRTEKSSGGGFWYTVRVHLGTDGDSVVVRRVPSPGGVELADKLKSADWHLPSAFRHPIQMPNLPAAWRNR